MPDFIAYFASFSDSELAEAATALRKVQDDRRLEEERALVRAFKKAANDLANACIPYWIEYHDEEIYLNGENDYHFSL